MTARYDTIKQAKTDLHTQCFMVETQTEDESTKLGETVSGSGKKKKNSKSPSVQTTETLFNNKNTNYLLSNTFIFKCLHCFQMNRLQPDISPLNQSCVVQAEKA